MRPSKQVEAIRYDGIGQALRYDTERTGTEIVGSDDYSVQGKQERPPEGCNTYLYKTSMGAFFQVQYFSDPSNPPVLTPLTESEAMQVWSDLAAGGTSPDKIPFLTVFPGTTITWA
jgi:hypothetical protein